MKRPFPKTWVVKEGLFLAGCFPGTEEANGTAERVASLVAAGVRTFICLQPVDERNTRTGIRFPDYEPILKRLEAEAGEPLRFYRLPVRDETAPTTATTAKALDLIDDSLARGRPAYLHCWGGHGRTGAIVGCWLVRHGASGEEALTEITRLRSGCPELMHVGAPNVDAQRELVRSWSYLDPAAGVVLGTTKTADKVRREYAPAEDERPAPGSRREAATLPTLPKDSPLLIGVEPLGLHDRYLGAMFGLAVGDAVGTALEFKRPGSFEPISDMVGGGPFGLEVGHWTDDTSMALCLAESLVHVGGNSAHDQMRRYVAWWKQGHLSSTGKCFDIGGTTRAALSRFMQSGDPMAGSNNSDTAGNGSLMRLAPIPLAYRVNVDSAIGLAADSSRTTHGATEAVDACRFMTVLLIRVLGGASKDELLQENLWETSLHHPTDPLAPKVLAVAKGSYKTKKPPVIRGTGYVVDCLEAALWAFHHHDSYESAILAAANLGDDADTTAAVCGQIAGAFYGLTGMPGRWVERVAMGDTIAQLARGLLTLSKFLDESGH